MCGQRRAQSLSACAVSGVRRLRWRLRSRSACISEPCGAWLARPRQLGPDEERRESSRPLVWRASTSGGLQSFPSTHLCGEHPLNELLSGPAVCLRGGRPEERDTGGGEVRERAPGAKGMPARPRWPPCLLVRTWPLHACHVMRSGCRATRPSMGFPLQIAGTHTRRSSARQSGC